MKNSIILAIAFLFIPFFMQAQSETYSAHYKTDIFMNISDLEELKDALSDYEDILQHAVKVTTFEKYITADQHYMSIKTVYPSFNKETKITTLDSTLLKIDKKRGLLFNEKEQKFYKIKISEITNSGHKVALTQEDETSVAFKDPDIPSEIMPVFNQKLDANGGITVFICKNFVARLQDWKKSEDKLDYSTLFANAGKQKDLEAISLF